MHLDSNTRLFPGSDFASIQQHFLKIKPQLCSRGDKKIKQIDFKSSWERERERDAKNALNVFCFLNQVQT